MVPLCCPHAALAGARAAPPWKLFVRRDDALFLVVCALAGLLHPDGGPSGARAMGKGFLMKRSFKAVSVLWAGGGEIHRDGAAVDRTGREI